MACSVAAMIPRTAHFVFGLRPQDEPFHLVHYLALASCREVVAPDEIVVHCGHLPYGFYWDLARRFVTLERIDPEPPPLRYDDPNVARYAYAHHADFVRLDALADHGGIYADIDTLFLAPPPGELWEEACVLGREADVQDQRTGEVRPSVSNALIMAEPGSAFVGRWRDQMGEAFDGSWSAHSCFLAHDLARAHPDEVRIEPERTFHPFPPNRDGLRRLLVERHAEPGELDGVVSVHLAAHLWWAEDRRDFVPEVHARVIDERWVRAGGCTYAAAAARFLPEHTAF